MLRFPSLAQDTLQSRKGKLLSLIFSLSHILTHILILTHNMSELDVLVCHVNVSNERFQFLSFDLDQWVVHISKSVAGSRSSERLQNPLLHLLHIEVSHDRRHWITHSTAVFLSVKNVIIVQIWSRLNLVLVCRELWAFLTASTAPLACVHVKREGNHGFI